MRLQNFTTLTSNKWLTPKKINKKSLFFFLRKTQFGYANFRLKKLPNSILDQIITKYYFLGRDLRDDRIFEIKIIKK